MTVTVRPIGSQAIWQEISYSSLHSSRQSVDCNKLFFFQPWHRALWRQQVAVWRMHNTGRNRSCVTSNEKWQNPYRENVYKVICQLSKLRVILHASPKKEEIQTMWNNWRQSYYWIRIIKYLPRLLEIALALSSWLNGKSTDIGRWRSSR